MQMDAGLDTGPIIDAIDVPIDAARDRRHAARQAGRARALRAIVATLAPPRAATARSTSTPQPARRRHLRGEDRPQRRDRSTGRSPPPRSSGGSARSIPVPGATSRFGGEHRQGLVAREIVGSTRDARAGDGARRWTRAASTSHAATARRCGSCRACSRPAASACPRAAFAAGRSDRARQRVRRAAG